MHSPFKPIRPGVWNILGDPGVGGSSDQKRFVSIFKILDLAADQILATNSMGSQGPHIFSTLSAWFPFLLEGVCLGLRNLSWVPNSQNIRIQVPPLAYGSET